MLRKLILYRPATTIFWGLLVLSVVLSLGIRFALLRSGLTKPEMTSIGSTLGYLGGMSFFVPVSISIVLDYRARKLDELVATAGKNKERFAQIAARNKQFMARHKARNEIYNLIGFCLITLGFAVGI